MITIFANINETKLPYHITVDQALKRIGEGTSRDLCTRIRLEPDKDRRNKMKMQLPCVLFSGQFRERSREGFVKHSGFVCLDFDGITPEPDDYTYAQWMSPSGNGVKRLVKIKDGGKHEEAVLALMEEYPTADKACKDVSRVCYESYDPNLYRNDKALVYDKQVVTNRHTHKVIETDQEKIYTNLKKWLEKKGEVFHDGQRNNYLNKLAYACNCFGISKDSARSLLMYDYVNAASQFTIRELDTILNSAYKSMAVHGHAKFEKEETTHERQILEYGGHRKDVIYLRDVEGDLDRDYEVGTPGGETTYFPAIDDHFRWMRGEVTLLGGIGNYGKSTFLMHLCLLKSVFEGCRWAFFSPEQAPPIFFYRHLICQYIGQGTFAHNKMGADDFTKGKRFIDEHFYYVYPKDASPTPEYIRAVFGELYEKKKIDGCVIDPFNQLQNDWMKNSRDDHYLDAFLSEHRRMAQGMNIYSLIVAHPHKLMKGKDGNYECPDVYDFSGGAMWNNKCDNILQFHRPNYQQDKTDTLAEFRSQKIKKQELNGIPGTVLLDYNRETFRFYWQNWHPIEGQRDYVEKETPF